MFDKRAKTDFPILDEIANRWSPRAFGEKPVEDEKLLRIFEAVRWASSSRNEQPWRFLVARKGDAHYDKLFEGFNEPNGEWAWTAPVIGLSLAVKHFEYKNRENSFRTHDVGMAMGNFLAQATREGLHAHQMAGIRPEKLIENFGIDTVKFEVVAMFALGYFDESRLDELDEKYREREKEERSRKNLGELVFANGIGDQPDWLKER